jgi:N-acetylneuraminate synthase
MINGIALVAEIGINHNGSVDIAKKLIDVAVENGCDFVKFQKRDIDLVYTKEELDAPRESPWGKTNREQKMGLEFSVDQYKEIDLYCKSKKVGWFVSCWDLKSLDEMELNFPDMPFHKVASALLTDRLFLQELKKTGRPVILSTGLSTEEQITEASKILGDALDTVLHCTSTYPTKPEEMNLTYLNKLREDRAYYDLKHRIGFSNHYSGLAWVPVVVALGAEMIEFHVTLDRTMYGSDQAASIEPEGVKKLVDYVAVTSKMLGHGRKEVYLSEQPIIKKLRKRVDF